MKTLLCACLSLVIASVVYSGEGDKPREQKPGKPGKGEHGKRGDGRWDRGFEFIFEHAKDLNLTGEQTKKLNELKDQLGAKFDEMKKDPEMVELYTAMREARQSEDREHIAEVHKKIRAAMEKKGVKPEEAMLAVGKILDRSQLAKLAELRKASGMDERPLKKLREERAAEANEDEHERPDPNKGAPSLYENESTSK